MEQNWQIFEGVFHGAPELLFLMNKKSGKGITWLFKGQEGNVQAVETGMGILRGVWGHYPVMQGWAQDGQELTVPELPKGHKESKER